MDALKQGKSYTTIQNELGVYPATIARVKKKHGIATITAITTNNAIAATTHKKSVSGRNGGANGVSSKGVSSRALIVIAHCTNGIPDKYYAPANHVSSVSAGGVWVTTPEAATHYTITEAVQIVRGLLLKAPANSDGKSLTLLQATPGGKGAPKQLLDLGGEVRKLGEGGVVVPAAEGWFTTNLTCSNSNCRARLLLTREMASRGYKGICPKCGTMVL